ncbi:hypothetical protein EG240_15905 [Paenimyroides tangerinum]|uniref:Uncharacterized protein n=1 Tax=Paenimyroides tangerinum TaxID=2488728 RepID=A0A3P3VV54_9FLAO|nr:hypothetical protein [Paenimyroides tangerinum]RRJ86692.1 hypothetical protein EG240_15905 [Paenimyroides tangerinum]
MLIKLKQAIIKASEELNSNQLIYFIHFNFGWPSQSLKISDIELLQNIDYDLKFEFGSGIGEEDLETLVQQGFLKKISETVDEYDPLEKSIEYEIIKAV